IAEKLTNDERGRQAAVRLADIYTASRLLVPSREAPSDVPAALALVRRGVALWEKLSWANPDVVGLRSNLAFMWFMLGYVQQAEGNNTARLEEQLHSIETSKQLSQEVAIARPDVPEYRAKLAELHGEASWRLATLNRLREALEENSKGRKLLEDL